MINKAIKDSMEKKETLKKEINNPTLKQDLYDAIMYTNLSDVISKSDLKPEDISKLIDANRNVINTEEEIIVRVDLPGIKKENISTSLTESEMFLKATFNEEDVIGSSFYTNKEKEDCSIEKTIKFPEEVVPDEASAKFENGVLIVKAPKESVSNKISVKIE